MKQQDTLTECERRQLLAMLTGKQRRWLDCFISVARLNGTEAARVAGYRGNNQTLYQTGIKNRRNPKIARLIEDHLTREALSSKEVLARLAVLARSDVTNFLRLDEHGNYVVDLKKGIGAGYGAQVHRVKQTERMKTITKTCTYLNEDGIEVTETQTQDIVEVETTLVMHNPKPALDSILRALGSLEAMKPSTDISQFFATVRKGIFGVPPG